MALRSLAYLKVAIHCGTNTAFQVSKEVSKFNICLCNVEEYKV